MSCQYLRLCNRSLFSRLSQFVTCSRTTTGFSHRLASSSASEDVSFESRKAFVASKIVEVVSDHKNRLFAVVFINGRQYKVSDGDVIVVENRIPAALGDRIKLEKVLLVAGKDFTLLGRPLVGTHLASVEATVVEKSTAQPEIDYLKLDGKKVQKTNWTSRELTTLRINKISVDPEHIQPV